MRKNTEIWLGMRHVGKSDCPDEITSHTCESALKQIIEFTLKNSLAQRFEFVMARTQEEIQQRFGKAQDGKHDAMIESFSTMFDEIEGID